MTNMQLYVAIGVPLVFNTAFVLFCYGALNQRFNSLEGSINERFAALNQRFDDMRDLWRAELRRVEEVLDARLKHLEER